MFNGVHEVQFLFPAERREHRLFEILKRELWKSLFGEVPDGSDDPETKSRDIAGVWDKAHLHFVDVPR